MANLKDINYGIGKYLVASDFPAIATNRNNLSLLNFKVATNNSYALYSFKDGMIDAYMSEAGVDTSASTNETYNAAGDYYSGNESNMTLLSNAFTAQTAPTTARIILDEYTSTGSSTLNTDIKAYASRDNGTTYTQITLASQGTIETNHRLLSGSVDISGQPSGTNMKYKIETLNQSLTKETRVYGTSMAWA